MGISVSEQSFKKIKASLSSRQDLHLVRKLWHAVCGTIIGLTYFSGLSRPLALKILSVLLITAVSWEIIRFRFDRFNQFSFKAFKWVMRKEEVTRPSGIPYYLAGALFVVYFFPWPIAILSILYLAYGDPIASLVGLMYGHHSLKFKNGKSLIGAMAGAVVCFIVSFIFMRGESVVPPNSLFAFSLLGGLAGGLAELLPFQIDDNLTIPVVSGSVLWVSFSLMGLS